MSLQKTSERVRTSSPKYKADVGLHTSSKKAEKRRLFLERQERYMSELPSAGNVNVRLACQSSARFSSVEEIQRDMDMKLGVIMKELAR
ncbi:hypothetical protein JX266_009279 [Neoarthrinium moseri]|nr:hypothetical protein JX266_009279 [Neoarthrinium moseri]